ncbi:MAG: Na+/H+ antiporter subunit E [Gammaproteobacteria bacterium]|nr:Na+/H+ antiporter subunit E [Gammaproteobacteria bacterium]
MRDRYLPHPLMSLTLLIVWLLLVNSLSLGHVLLGALFGLLIPIFTNPFWPERPHLARPLLIVQFIFHLLMDIVIANLQVARTILSPKPSIQPDFVAYPLVLRNEFAITILASVIALTPGTVAAALSDDRKLILIHALDVPDPQKLIATLKSRYEAPLLEILPE